MRTVRIALCAAAIALAACAAAAADEAGAAPAAAAAAPAPEAAAPEALKAAEDLQSLSSAQLSKLEQDTLSSVKESEQELSGLRSDIAILRQNQMSLTEQADRVQGALNWEADEKKKREAELDAAKKDVEEKHLNIQRMSERVTDLKDQIQTLQEHLKNLTRAKDRSVRRALKPSLGDVIDARASEWNPVSKNVYVKTKNYVSSGVTGMSSVTAAYRSRVSSNPTLDLVASLLLYGFFVLGAFTVHKVYVKVRGSLTVDRLLFLGDAFCAGFWGVMLLCYCFLWMDPLIAVQARSPVVFFFFQLAALVCYVNFVLLRVLLLASKLSLSALGETLSVVVVGHHYYVRVWQPAILDQPIHGTFFYYFCYAWLFLAFAYNRVHEFAPLKQLRGPRLPPLVALRVLFSRFTAKGVPEGDLESRPFVELGSDDDDHQS